MAGHPSAGELITAVRTFIAGLALEGRDGFHAKVAANVLAIVERELAAPSPIGVLGLNDAALSTAIRAGILTVATPGLVDALIVATVARLQVDNPRYATLARLKPISPNAAVQR